MNSNMPNEYSNMGNKYSWIAPQVRLDWIIQLRPVQDRPPQADLSTTY